MWIFGDTPPARNIYSRSAKTFFIYFFHLQGILKEKIWDNSHISNTWPDGGCMKLLASAHWVHSLISSLRPAWRGTSTRPTGTGTDSPLREGWKAHLGGKGKTHPRIPLWMQICEIYTPWLSLQATRGVHLQAYNEYEYHSLDYVAHTQVKHELNCLAWRK